MWQRVAAVLAGSSMVAASVAAATLCDPPRLPIDTAGRVREVRVGLVLYGGVSLAVYMHGTTRELHNLVIASRAFEARWERERLPASTARVYYDALADLAAADPDGVKTRIVVDTIAGTSAGGINGVFLAKALAEGLPQDSLRDLWFDKGDIRKLMGGRLRGVLRLLRARPPLRGDLMYRWVFEALEMMHGECREAAPGRTLVPPGDQLTLSVPTTDFYGYGRSFVIGHPPAGLEKEHRKVLEFRHPGGAPEQGFGRQANPILAFAARSTSSFPGAFPPVALGELSDAPSRLSAAQLQELVDTHFREYSLDGADVLDTSFVDGGVLDNYPFHHVLEELRRRAPRHEVERRLLYVQPDPGRPPGKAPSVEPKYLKTLWGALSTIARVEPIGDDFLALERFNESVELASSIIAATKGAVQERLRRTGFDLDKGTAPTAGAQVSGSGSELSDRAYVELRAYAVVDQLGRSGAQVCRFPEGAVRRALFRQAVFAWALDEQLLGPAADLEAQEALREDLDVGFTWRQLRFVAEQLNTLYGLTPKGQHPDRADLDSARTRLAGHIAQLHTLMVGEDVSPSVLEQANRLCAAIEGWALDQPLELAGQLFIGVPENREIVAGLRQAVTEHARARRDAIVAQAREDYRRETANWRPEARAELYLAYYGFPVWDAMIYPYQRLSNVGEFAPVRAVRLSPNDARALGSGSAKEKLGGAKVAHFGAFFKRSRREQDYLWGRLDGFERLLALLDESDRERRRRTLRDPEAAGAATPSSARLRGGFLAVLDEEAASLGAARSCVDGLRQRLAAADWRPAEAGALIPMDCQAR